MSKLQLFFSAFLIATLSGRSYGQARVRPGKLCEAGVKKANHRCEFLTRKGRTVHRQATQTENFNHDIQNKLDKMGSFNLYHKVLQSLWDSKPTCDFIITETPLTTADLEGDLETLKNCEKDIHNSCTTMDPADEQVRAESFDNAQQYRSLFLPINKNLRVCSDVAMFENFITPIKANAARVNQIRQHRKAVHDKCVKQVFKECSEAQKRVGLYLHYCRSERNDTAVNNSATGPEFPPEDCPPESYVCCCSSLFDMVNLEHWVCEEPYKKCCCTDGIHVLE